MTREEIMQKLEDVGLVDKGHPITFNAFKNKASIHRYGDEYKAAYVGIPGTSLWGFFFEYADDKTYLKKAYAAFIKVVEGDDSYVNDGQFPYIKWMPRLPNGYGNRNAKKKKRVQLKINFGTKQK